MPLAWPGYFSARSSIPDQFSLSGVQVYLPALVLDPTWCRGGRRADAGRRISRGDLPQGATAGRVLLPAAAPWRPQRTQRTRRRRTGRRLLVGWPADRDRDHGADEAGARGTQPGARAPGPCAGEARRPRTAGDRSRVGERRRSRSFLAELRRRSLPPRRATRMRAGGRVTRSSSPIPTAVRRPASPRTCLRSPS
jgi:hypothetical protein